MAKEPSAKALDRYYTDQEFFQAVTCELKGKKRKVFFDKLKEKALSRYKEDRR